MKKWFFTVLTMLGLVALAWKAKIWVPWLLSFATKNKDEVEPLNNLLEILFKIFSIAGAIVLPVYRLWREKRGAPGEVPPRVLTSLHQLPAPLADFTGREDDLKELLTAILVGGVHISGLQGQGGVGKTALALKLAAALTPNFQDAQIYLDLKGVSETPVTASEAMSHVLRAFHPEIKLPNAEHELSAFYQSVLYDKRVLLLMDNAKDAVQLKFLLPPRGCALIVTSRSHFTLPGLHQKNIDTLPPEDAIRLLLRIAPAIGGEAESIARSCGYLALALRLAATAIAEHFDLAPQDYRQKLADENQRLGLLGGDEGVDASIALSHNLMNGELQKRWHLLAIFPDTFDASGPTAVWEVEAETAKETLGYLLQNSMIQWNVATKRYRLHDLIRDFARQRLTADESLYAFRNHAKHYGAILASCDRFYHEGSDSIMRGLALFDVEWGNIQAGQAWATAHMATDQEAAKLCSSYTDWGIRVLDLRRHQGEQLRWREAALAAARFLNDRAADSRHLSNVGVTYSDSGEYRRAIAYQEDALSIAIDINDQWGKGTALGRLGNAYYSLGDYPRAVDYQEKALVIARSVGDQRGEGNALGSLGVAYADSGDYKRAIDYQEQRLFIARTMGDQQAEGQALGNLGIAHRSLGDYRRAIDDHKKALAIDHAIGDLKGEGRDLGNLGFAYANLGENRDAMSFYEKTLAIARKIGDPRSEGNTLGNMSLVLDKLGHRKRAIEYGEASLQIRERIEDPNAATMREQLEKWRTN